MKDVSRVGWSITHQEFTVTDYYYFSFLQKKANEFKLELNEVDRWKDLENYDTIVFNYPEIPFTEDEVRFVQELVEVRGKKVILLGYYKNEDKIADTCNTLARAFGMELNCDEVTDEVNNYKGDKYFVVTSKIRRYKEGVGKVLLPCTASIKPLMPDIKVVARAEDTAKSNQENYPLLIAEHFAPKSGGYFCLAGTCVFWDNYSIGLFDNLRFSMNLLYHNKESLIPNPS